MLNALFPFIADRSRLRREARDRSKQAFRPGTRANHRSHALLFLAFADYFGFEGVPADTETLVCFAEFLFRSYTALKSVTNALASVKRLHLDLGMDIKSFGSNELQLWLRAAELTCRHVPVGAAPLPVYVLEVTCRRALELGERGVIFSALMAVMFYSMTRISSLVPGARQGFDSTRLPTIADVELLHDGTAVLRVKWAKNAQRAEAGFRVPLLPVAGSPACPVENLSRLLRLGGQKGGHAPLFGFRAGRAGRVGTYHGFTIPLARSWFDMLLAAGGYSAGKGGFSLHSLRKGACSLAFKNGAAEADLQALGGWHSAAVRTYYSRMDARKRAAAALNTA